MAGRTLRGLEHLFKEAREKGLWFHCGYQDLWFSPDELAEKNKEGKFIWGAVNWNLRDPQEALDELDCKIAHIKEAKRLFEERITKQQTEKV